MFKYYKDALHTISWLKKTSGKSIVMNNIPINRVSCTK